MLPTHVYGPPAMTLRCWKVIRFDKHANNSPTSYTICYLCPWQKFCCMNPTMNTAMLHKRNISNEHFPPAIFLCTFSDSYRHSWRGAAPGAAAAPFAETAADWIAIPPSSASISSSPPAPGAIPLTTLINSDILLPSIVVCPILWAAL